MRCVLIWVWFLFFTQTAFGQNRFSYIRIEKYAERMKIDSVYFAIDCNTTAVSRSHLYKIPVEIGRVINYDYVDSINTFVIPHRFRYIEGLVFSDSLLYVFFATLDSTISLPMIRFNYWNHLEDSIHFVVTNDNFFKNRRQLKQPLEYFLPRFLISKEQRMINVFRSLPLLSDCQRRYVKKKVRRNK